MKTSFPCLNVPVHALVCPFLCVGLLLTAAAPCRAGGPPPNDNLANAQVLPGGSFSVNGTEVGATQESFEKASDFPYYTTFDLDASVWYSWTPSVSGTLNANAASGGFDTAVFLFTGPGTPSGSTVLAVTSPNNPYIAPTHVTANQPYFFFVGNEKGGVHAFTFVGTLTPDSTPTSTPTPTPTPTPANAPVATLSVKTPKIDRAATKPGKVFVTLSPAPSSDLMLTYKIGGTAVNGTDYKMLKGSVTIPADQTSAEIKVKPLAGGSGTVSVKLSLTSGDGYTLGNPTAGKVKIVGGE